MYKKSLKMEVLEEAFNSFLDIINEYASQQSLSEEDKKQLLKLVEDAYVNKKIEYFLDERLSKFSSFLDFSYCFALKKPNSKDIKSNYSIAYVKHLKQLVANE